MTEKNKTNIVDLYLNNKSLSCIARTYGCHHQTIKKILMSFRIKIRSRSESQMGMRKAKKYAFNEDYFKKIDSDEKAYWLGMMYSDGYVSKENRVGISLIDREHIEKFKKSINSNNKIYSRKDGGYELILSSKKMQNDLIKNGVVFKKSHILKFPYFIDAMFVFPFIRGYFDGDGCVRIDKKRNLRMDFVGTENMLDGILSSLENNGVGRVKISDHGTVKRINFSGNKKCSNILKLMYDKASIFMSRKQKYFTGCYSYA